MSKAWVCKRDCFVDRYYFAGEIITDARVPAIVPMHFKELNGSGYSDWEREAAGVIPPEPVVDMVGQTMEDLYNSSHPAVYRPDDTLDKMVNSIVGAKETKATADTPEVDNSVVDDLIGDSKPAKKSKVAKKQQAV